MKRNILYIFLFLMVALSGCETYYVPDIDDVSGVLVVEGMLTDQNDFTQIKLTRSVSFNKQSYYYPEHKATVSIESESGLSYPASETGSGVYKTKDPVPTEVGEGYYVRIVTSAGDEYRSETEKMMSHTPIDSIYLSDSIFRDVSYDYWGNPVVSDYGGITFSIIPHENPGEEVGYLYKWNALVNYYVRAFKDGTDFNYYCWKQLSSDQIYVYEYVKDDYINELPISDIHSLSFQRLSPLPIDSSRFEAPIAEVYSTSFYYHLRQYAISKDASKFWRTVKNQSEATGKLFDAVEERIEGNIYCFSDSSKVAYGCFNAASFTDKVIGVQIVGNSHQGVKTFSMMPDSPKEEEDCYEWVSPDFWY